MSPSLSLQWKEALSLSRRQAPEFYQAGDTIEPGPHADAIRFALSDLDLAAVFCIEGVPTIAFLSKSDITLDRIDRVRFVSGQYSHGLPLAMMLGYVMNAQVEGAHVRLKRAMKRSKIINLKTTADLVVANYEPIRFSTTHDCVSGHEIQVTHTLLGWP